jgi:hypothetical protein
MRFRRRRRQEPPASERLTPFGLLDPKVASTIPEMPGKRLPTETDVPGILTCHGVHPEFPFFIVAAHAIDRAAIGFWVPDDGVQWIDNVELDKAVIWRTVCRKARIAHRWLDEASSTERV